MPSPTVLALVIPADAPPRTNHIGPDQLTALQQLIGGHIEGVSRHRWHAYVHSEGKLLNLAPNPVATTLLFPDHSDVICGTAVLLGDGHDGTEDDVPAGLIHTAAALWIQRLRQRPPP